MLDSEDIQSHEYSFNANFSTGSEDTMVNTKPRSGATWERGGRKNKYIDKMTNIQTAWVWILALLPINCDLGQVISFTWTLVFFSEKTALQKCLPYIVVERIKWAIKSLWIVLATSAIIITTQIQIHQFSTGIYFVFSFG